MVIGEEKSSPFVFVSVLLSLLCFYIYRVRFFKKKKSSLA